MMKKIAFWTAGALLLLAVASCGPNGHSAGREGGEQDSGDRTTAETSSPDPAASASKSTEAASEKTGGKTSASAPSTAPEKASGTVLPELTWRSQKLQLTHALDDGTVKHGSQKPKGKYVQVFMCCLGDGTLNWESVTCAQSAFLLRTTDGTDYSASATGFQLQNTDGVKLDELEQQTFRGVSPIFDIPIDLHLEQLSLVIKADDGSETDIISLDGVPDRESDVQS